MKLSITKISSLLVAFLVLFSTFSFTIESHYCGDFLVAVSFTGTADKCDMKMEQKPRIQKKNCCKDEVIKTDGQDELYRVSFKNLDFEKNQFSTTFLCSYRNLFIKKIFEKNIYKDGSPPDIPINYQVLYQSFLV